MTLLSIGTIYLINTISLQSTSYSLAPAFALFGIGFGLGTSQLNNIIISSVSKQETGEASAASSTIRQVGSAIGIALIGTILATSLNASIPKKIQKDSQIPQSSKPKILRSLSKLNVESGKLNLTNVNHHIYKLVKKDVDISIVDATKQAFRVGLLFVIIALMLSLFLPKKTNNPY